MNIVEKARVFATAAHAAVGQTRKYTGEPYINHPAEVVEIVASVPHTAEMLAAAWLHDVVEDTHVPLEVIRAEFGHLVGWFVSGLTDVSTPADGSRSVRKEIDRRHSDTAASNAKTIKLADLISNSRSIVERDPEFAKVYMREKQLLLEVLREGDATLWERANRIVTDYIKANP